MTAPVLAAVLARAEGEALPRIRVTDQDWQRLTSLVSARGERWSPQASAALDEELARAEVVSAREVGPDVVTMNSRVLYEVDDGGRRCVRTLVYPWDADEAAGRLSVLSPLGSALLGLRVGDAIDWPVGGGARVRVRVLEVPYQPEAEGDWML